ncbi:MAG: type II secretion system secretin GspD [Gammaproteobacteria bacterium]|nr:type II secretion system secretin GspD [Gammaproteobacteria bacterium]
MKRFLFLVSVFFVLNSTASIAGSLNVRDADVRALVTQISDITGKTFVVDPRVKGKVTVISNADMTTEDIYEVFKSVLHVHGYATVESGDVVKIIPTNGAKQDNLKLDVSGVVKGEQMVTQVIEVKHTSATELVPILRPMVPQYGHVAAVASANALIISDHAQNIRRIEKIIRRIDSAESEEVEVIHLQEAWVSDVVKLLENLSPAAAASKGKRQAVKKSSRVKIVADERTNRLILRGEKSARARIRRLVKELDKPSTKSGTVQVIYLQHADATKIAEIITGLLARQSQPTRVGKAGARGASGQTSSGEQSSMVQADEALNALVVQAEPGQMAEIKSIITQLDVRRAQVLIEAAIVEISASTGQDLGVQWGFGFNNEGPVGGVNFENVGNSISSIASAIANPTAAAAASLANGITLGGGKRNGDSLEFGAILQALASTANTNILSTPSLMTIDNQEAEIVVGQNVPFITGSSTNTGAGTSNPFTTVSREDIGLTLRVTPHIHDGDVLRLEIYQETSDLIAPPVGIDASDITTTKRSIKTVILADDGQTIVLGGLVRDDVIDSVSKVPLMGDLPLLGKLFRSNKQQHAKKNLMVFLRPTILRDDKSATALTHEKYSGIKQLQSEMKKNRGIIELEVDVSFPEDVTEVFR